MIMFVVSARRILNSFRNNASFRPSGIQSWRTSPIFNIFFACIQQVFRWILSIRSSCRIVPEVNKGTKSTLTAALKRGHPPRHYRLMIQQEIAFFETPGGKETFWAQSVSGFEELQVLPERRGRPETATNSETGSSTKALTEIRPRASWDPQQRNLHLMDFWHGSRVTIATIKN